jgi:glycosyltransferase involved in cell wall biosynthesis
MEVLRNAIGSPFQSLFHDANELARAKIQGSRLAYTSAPFRGLDVLLNCFSQLMRRRPSYELDIFSSMQVYYEDEAQHDFQPLYERCRTTKGVRYHASVSQPQLATELRSVNVFAYPSTFEETSCIAAMEALAAGAMVVTTDLGALAETCASFATLVPPLQSFRSRLEFEAAYLHALNAAMARIEIDPLLFAAQQFEQVKAIYASCTWDIRAAEWEAAGNFWLERNG